MLWVSVEFTETLCVHPKFFTGQPVKLRATIVADSRSWDYLLAFRDETDRRVKPGKEVPIWDWNSLAEASCQVVGTTQSYENR